jgi:uncharacterized membrane protein
MIEMMVEWAEALLRWTHVIAGIAWIGSSFYFIAADLSLRPGPTLPPGVRGETWQVHGGGFYHIQKYLVAPSQLPAELTWFKWEAYSTWIFGFLLLVSVYYLNPRLYLIDPAVLALAPWQAVAASLTSLALGWVLYHGLCRSGLGQNSGRLALLGFVLLAAAGAGYLQLFGGRAAYLHVGVLLGSLMVGNVLFVIIPNQKQVVADLLAGRQPPAFLGDESKQRSLHNNYLTLPVVFLMLSSHYPMTFAGPHPWPVLCGLFVVGFLVRHFFNQHHAGRRPAWWLWPAAAASVGLLLALTLPPLTPGPAAAPASFAEVQDIIARRCTVCHATHPQFPGITEAPKGVVFDGPADILARREQIREQVVILRAMPLNNLTQLEDQERAAIASWLAAGGAP